MRESVQRSQTDRLTELRRCMLTSKRWRHHSIFDEGCVVTQLTLLVECFSLPFRESGPAAFSHVFSFGSSTAPEIHLTALLKQKLFWLYCVAYKRSLLGNLVAPTRGTRVVSAAGMSILQVAASCLLRE